MEHPFFLGRRSLLKAMSWKCILAAATIQSRRATTFLCQHPSFLVVDHFSPTTMTHTPHRARNPASAKCPDPPTSEHLWFWYRLNCPHLLMPQNSCKSLRYQQHLQVQVLISRALSPLPPLLYDLPLKLPAPEPRTTPLKSAWKSPRPHPQRQISRRRNMMCLRG